jgi:hypothetical protein
MRKNGITFGKFSSRSVLQEVEDWSYAGEFITISSD